MNCQVLGWIYIYKTSKNVFYVHKYLYFWAYMLICYFFPPISNRLHIGYQQVCFYFICGNVICVHVYRLEHIAGVEQKVKSTSLMLEPACPQLQFQQLRFVHRYDNPRALPVQYNTVCSFHHVLWQLYQYLGPHLSAHTHKSQWMESELLPPLPLLLITTVCFLQSPSAILIGFA